MYANRSALELRAGWVVQSEGYRALGAGLERLTRVEAEEDLRLICALAWLDVRVMAFLAAEEACLRDF